MRLKDGFVLRQVAGSWVIVAVGARCVDFDGMLTLNESGAALWRLLEAGSDRQRLIQSLTEEYEVPEAQAGQDVDEFLDVLRGAGCLEE